MASIQPRGDTWRAFVKVGDTRESETFLSKREAVQWAAKRETELRAERTGTIGHQKTLKDAMTRYIEELCPKHKGGHWETLRLKKFMRDPTLPLTLPLERLAADHFTRWKLERQKQVKDSSVARELKLISQVLGACRKDWSWMKHSPLSDVRRPKESRHRTRLVSWSEQRIMLRTLGHERERPRTAKQLVAVAFLLALRTGMRAGEIVSLRWENVHPGWVWLPDTKNDDGREVPLSSKAQRLLERLRGLDGDRCLPLGKNETLDQASRSLDANFRKYRQQAGLDGFRFHDTRHTAATRIGRTVGQPGKLSFIEFVAVFGWKDPRFAMVYCNPSAASLSAKL